MGDGSTTADLQLKNKLTFDEMIDHLEAKGIQFNIMSKKTAKKTLMNMHYYYKISSYRRNFLKNQHGKYVNLDFAYLADLAEINVQLRYLVLQTCLDIEHAIKTRLLTDITNDPDEDGFSIVEEFCEYGGVPKKHYMYTVSEDSQYNFNMYTQFQEDMPVWVYFEFIPFGALANFVEFYYTTRGNEEYAELCEVLKYVRNIRNAAAHNNPLIMDIVATGQLTEPVAQPVAAFSRSFHAARPTARKKKLSNKKIHDLTALFYVYDRFIPRAK